MLAHRVTRVTVALVLVASLVLFGCSPGQQGTPENGTPTEGEGNGLGIVTYAIDSDITQWDPSLVFDVSNLALLNIYEPLLYYDPANDDFIPCLATSWEHNEDATEWTFHLREGVTFSDGEKFDASVVKDSIERTLDLNQGAAFIWSAVEDIEVVDDYTVTFHLGYPAALDLIASSGYGTYMISPAVMDNDPDWFNEGRAIGTGPYKLKDWTPGEQIVLEKNPDYWGGWDDPHFDVAILKIVREWSTSRQLLEAGDVDLIREVPRDAIEALQNNPDVAVDNIRSFENLLGLMNMEKSPTDDIAVRRALSHAIDYDSIVNDVLNGYGYASVGPIPANLWGHDPDLQQPQYDLDKVQEYLDQSQYSPDEMKMTLTYDQGDDREQQVAEMLKADLARFGVDLSLTAMPWETRWPSARNDETAPNIFLFYWWPTTVTPYDWLVSMFHSEDAPVYNISRYSSEEFDSLIDSGASIEGVDREKAADYYSQAQELLMQDVPSLFIFENSYVTARRADIKGFVNNPAYPHVVFFYQLSK